VPLDAEVAAERKRTLRSLRKLELRMRGVPAQGGEESELVWATYFSTEPEARVRYPFSIFSVLDRDSRKRVVDEFLEAVVLRMLSPGAPQAGLRYARLLDFLGLPAAASPPDVRTRFHEMAHELHPDHGGDAGLMAELLQLYREIK
jgi:hypothetical protein